VLGPGTANASNDNVKYDETVASRALKRKYDETTTKRKAKQCKIIGLRKPLKRCMISSAKAGFIMLCIFGFRKDFMQG
jgi:hypothetical protein